MCTIDKRYVARTGTRAMTLASTCGQVLPPLRLEDIAANCGPQVGSGGDNTQQLGAPIVPRPVSSEINAGSRSAVAATRSYDVPTPSTLCCISTFIMTRAKLQQIRFQGFLARTEM